MISSPEDALLLIKKWRSGSAKVLAFISPPDKAFVSRFEGLIAGIDEAKFAVRLQSGEDFILFNLLSCKIGYGEAVDMASTFDEAQSDEARKWEATLCLVYNGRTAIVLCTMEE
jgi:hypothetical protein